MPSTANYLLVASSWPGVSNMKREANRVYFTEPANSLLISDTPGQEEEAKRYFSVEDLTLNFVSGSQYLGAYLGL